MTRLWPLGWLAAEPDIVVRRPGCVSSSPSLRIRATSTTDGRGLPGARVVERTLSPDLGTVESPMIN